MSRHKTVRSLYGSKHPCGIKAEGRRTIASPPARAGDFEALRTDQRFFGPGRDKMRATIVASPPRGLAIAQRDFSNKPTTVLRPVPKFAKIPRDKMKVVCAAMDERQ